jgi:hypothetical protein
LNKTYPTIYLDFDGTITRYCKNGEILKKDAIKFLKFLTDNFNVKWCSLNDFYLIRLMLLFYKVPISIISKIKYFNCSNTEFNKVAAIIKETQNFIFIDDDRADREISALKKINLEDNFIKADSYIDDLDDIIKIIKTKIRGVI